MNQFSDLKIRKGILSLLLEEELPYADAVTVADCLIETSLHGIDTHGVSLLPVYVNELRLGISKKRPKISIEDSGKFALTAIEADHSLGIVAGKRAMDLAIELAQQFGIGAVCVRNSNHFAAAGYYAKLAADRGLIGISFTNSDALVAPFKGTDAVNGTNPLAFAVRGEADDLFLLDMATSQVSVSKLLKLQDDQLALSKGWCIAGDGPVPTLTPLGGYKGQGLGMMVQILTAVMALMPLDIELDHLYGANSGAIRKTGHFMVAINPNSIAPRTLFQKKVSQLMSNIRQSTPTSGGQVMCPGDKENLTKIRRLNEGIPLDAATYELLSEYLTNNTTSKSLMDR